MEIKVFPNGIYGATTYLVYDKISKEGVVIDCTGQIKEIKKIVDKEHISLKYGLVTHGHFDHVYCVKEFKEAFPSTPVLMHKDDVDLLDSITTQCNMAGVVGISVPCMDGLLDDNSHNLKLGDKEIKIIHTKGHSKGSVCYLIGDSLFSGDTLFKESIGRCDLYGGSIEEIKDSIVNKLYTLEEETKVYPGHGEPTTIGYEKKYNPYFRGSY